MASFASLIAVPSLLFGVGEGVNETVVEGDLAGVVISVFDVGAAFPDAARERNSPRFTGGGATDGDTVVLSWLRFLDDAVNGAVVDAMEGAVAIFVAVVAACSLGLCSFCSSDNARCFQ